MKKAFMFVSIISALMTGCLNDTYPITADGIDSNAACVALSVASISVGGNQSSTRSTSLADGDAIGISRIADGIYTAQSNFKYVNTVNVWGAANSINKIVLAGNNNATLCAYSPYSSSTDISAIPLTSGVYSTASDFCYGYKPGVNSTNMGTGVSFSLNHAYAKLTLHFTKGVTFSGVGNVKKIAVAGGASSATLNLSAASASTSNATTGTPVTVGNGTTTLFNTVISTAYDVDLLMVPASVSSGLTFTINVDGTDKTATLPASLLSELVANTNYTISLEIAQKNSLDLGGATGTNYVSVTDWLIPPSVTNSLTDLYHVQPESNSYIVSPNSTIYIPVSRATSGNANNFPLGSFFTCGLLWSDVSDTHVTATKVGRYIKVTTGSTEGNSVVSAKNTNGVIAWSWHIWVTKYNPGLAANTGTNTTTYDYNSNIWMDRNLGATTSTMATVTTKGLLYQWGRKDPFPSSSTLTDNADPTLFGEKTAIGKNPVAASPNLVNSIQNPWVFYYSGSANNDWYTVGIGIQNDALWYNGTATKTIYDPCPVGWRVPFYIDTNSLWNPLTAGTWNYGYSLTPTPNRGYYPAAGVRMYDTGNCNYTGGGGYYYTANPSGTNASVLGFDNTVFKVYPSSRVFGCSVRCVKE